MRWRLFIGLVILRRFDVGLLAGRRQPPPTLPAPASYHPTDRARYAQRPHVSHAADHQRGDARPAGDFDRAL